MRYLSVCSGIEAATVAWQPLGWQAVGFAEIAKFPAQVLAHHYPSVPNFGDLTQHDRWPLEGGSVDLLVGGTPCQSFSLIGLRGGFADPRGQLTLEFIRLAKRLRPRWIVWENVPGILSSGGGRDFGSFLGALAGCGYGICYRVLDAQYWGLAQRRRRVFVIGYLGDWRYSAAVLFERARLQGKSTPSRKARQDQGYTANTAPSSVKCSSEYARTGDSKGKSLVVAGHFAPAVAKTITAGEGYRYDWETVNLIPVIVCGSHSQPNSSINASGPVAMQSLQVRRLTPVECERLQGFPDGYTDIRPNRKDTPDGPRYKALGNSMAVPVIRWIGERIAKVE